MAFMVLPFMIGQGLIRPKRILDAPRIIVLLAVLLTAASPAAFPAPPATREEALAALDSAKAAARAEAVAWLADHGTMQDAALLQPRLRDREPLVRRYAEEGLWAIWTRSGDAGIDAQMARASDAMQSGRLAEAIEILTSVTKAKPGFAEGWNRRATAYYLAGDLERSIADCAEALKLNPGHFGALSGLGQIHARLENWHEALRWFRRALEVNPNMASVEANIERIEALLEEQRRNSI
jgi:tetratricopeptide (TPR) repeat protein